MSVRAATTKKAWASMARVIQRHQERQRRTWCWAVSTQPMAVPAATNQGTRVRTLAGCSDAANSGREPVFFGRCCGIGQVGALDPDQVGDCRWRDGMPAGVPTAGRSAGHRPVL